MPRLGNDDDDDNEMQPLNNNNRRQAMAYPSLSSRSRSVLYMLVFVSIFWIVPNFLLRDYRQEALDSLRASGKTDEEIQRWLPGAKTVKEMRQQQANIFTALQKEVQDLKQRVQELEAHVQMPNRTTTTTTAAGDGAGP